MAEFLAAVADKPAALPRSVCQRHDVLGNAASLISYFNVVPRTKTIAEAAGSKRRLLHN